MKIGEWMFAHYCQLGSTQTTAHLSPVFTRLKEGHKGEELALRFRLPLSCRLQET